MTPGQFDTLRTINWFGPRGGNVTTEDTQALVTAGYATTVDGKSRVTEEGIAALNRHKISVEIAAVNTEVTRRIFAAGFKAGYVDAGGPLPMTCYVRYLWDWLKSLSA